VINVPSVIMFLCSPGRGWTAPPASPASLLPVPPLRVTGALNMYVNFEQASYGSL
jgi:hypothetical protein